MCWLDAAGDIEDSELLAPCGVNSAFLHSIYHVSQCQSTIILKTAMDSFYSHHCSTLWVIPVDCRSWFSV